MQKKPEVSVKITVDLNELLGKIKKETGASKKFIVEKSVNMYWEKLRKEK